MSNTRRSFWESPLGFHTNEEPPPLLELFPEYLESNGL